MPARPLRVGPAQPGAYLLRAPALLELAGHCRPQLRVDQQATGPTAAGSLCSTGVGKIRVVDAAVVGQSVAAQLAADGRHVPTQTPPDLPHRQPALTQRSDTLPLEQAQISIRPLILGHHQRRHPTVLVAPPIPGLAPDPDPARRLDRTDTDQDQLPILRLHTQAALAPSSRHQHIPFFHQECCDELLNPSACLPPCPPPGGQNSDAVDTATTTRSLRPSSRPSSTGPTSRNGSSRSRRPGCTATDSSAGTTTNTSIPASDCTRPPTCTSLNFSSRVMSVELGDGMRRDSGLCGSGRAGVVPCRRVVEALAPRTCSRSPHSCPTTSMQSGACHSICVSPGWSIIGSP